MDDARYWLADLEEQGADIEGTLELRRMVDWQIVNNETTQVESPP